MNKEETKRPIDEAREQLKLLSLEVLDLVEAGTFHTVNDAIMETMYRNDTHREFKSYRQWRKDGYQVRKGEKAFHLWARPKDVERIKEKEAGKEGDAESEKFKYFPIAYLFSNAQVDVIEQEQHEPEPKHKEELEPLPYS